MPDIKPQDYTTGELTHAANVCNDAAELLEPASNELMRIVDDIEPERPEEALLYARTARHLGGAVFHLKASEATIRRITTNVGHTYTSVTSWYRGLALTGWAVVTVLALLRFLLPDHTAQIITKQAPFALGFVVGVSAAHWILQRRTARRYRDR